MARLRVTATALAAGALLWCSYAKADPITVKAATPPTGTQTTLVNMMTSPISFAGVADSGFTLTGSGVGTPPDLPGRFSTNSITTGASSAHQEIRLWFTEQNLTAPAGLPLEIVSGLTANLLFNATATLSTYLDPTNGTAPPTGSILLSSHTFTSNGTNDFTTMVPAQTGPYSLQEVYDITSLRANESTNLTIDVVATAIPEPSSLALLGTGLLGLAVLLFRRGKLRPTHTVI